MAWQVAESFIRDVTRYLIIFVYPYFFSEGLDHSGFDILYAEQVRAFRNESFLTCVIF